MYWFFQLSTKSQSELSKKYKLILTQRVSVTNQNKQFIRSQISQSYSCSAADTIKLISIMNIIELLLNKCSLRLHFRLIIHNSYLDLRKEVEI